MNWDDDELDLIWEADITNFATDYMEVFSAIERIVAMNWDGSPGWGLTRQLTRRYVAQGGCAHMQAAKLAAFDMIWPERE